MPLKLTGYLANTMTISDGVAFFSMSLLIESGLQSKRKQFEKSL